MRTALLATALVLATTSSACRVDSMGIDTNIVSASLSDHQAIALVIIGGATWGEAILTFKDTVGVDRQVPVAFAGPSGGLVMDVHVAKEDFLWNGSDSAELQIPEGGVPADELLGLYDGGGGAIALGLGYCDLQLDNDASVRLVITGACGGMGMARSENWLTMTTDGEVTEVIDDGSGT